MRLQITTLRSQALEQSYHAASSTGANAGWSRPWTSARSEIQTALPFLRASARDLVRNNPFASRAVRSLVSHISGSGVRPSPVVPATDQETQNALKGLARDQWERFVDNCDPDGQVDFYGQQRLMTRAAIEGGEALRVWIPIAENGRLFWRCRVLEGDYLDHLRNEVREDGTRIVQGIEYDAVGRRTHYWLYDEHPGDRYRGTMSAFNVRRVPAAFVDHVFEVLRPGQVRGVSWFAPVAHTLKDVADLAEAEVVRKKLEACIAMVVHNSNDPDSDGPTLGTAAPTDASGAALKNASGTTVESLTPGLILEAREGWDVSFNAPPASVGLTEHMKERLHAISAGIGTTYTQMTGDLSGANYSSMRAGELDYYRLLDCWQDDLMVFQSGARAFRRIMEAGVANGLGALAQVRRAKWTPPARPWVDPKKDAEGALLQVAARVQSPLELIERSGRTPEEVLDEFQAWGQLLAARGLAEPNNQQDETNGDTRRDEEPEGD